MKVIITKVDAKRKSKHGAYYVRCYFKSIEDNKSYRLDVYESHSKSARWFPYIQPQAIFDEVRIFSGNILDGTSNFKFLGVKK
jgi:hypothetical protein